MSFKLSRLDDQGIGAPGALTKNVDAGTTVLTKGALVLLQSDNEWAECGADPAAVAAVGLHAYGSNTSGFGAIAGRKEFPPNKLVAIPVKGRHFRAQYVGTAALGEFGVIKDSDDEWKVDFNETTTKVVRVVRILENTDKGFGSIDEVECTFIDSVATNL